jgi:hypothetical protein
MRVIKINPNEAELTWYKHRCKCGADFKERKQLIEHIGLLNPHWPRSSPEDEHGVASVKEEET